MSKLLTHAPVSRVFNGLNLPALNLELWVSAMLDDHLCQLTWHYKFRYLQSGQSLFIFKFPNLNPTWRAKTNGDYSSHDPLSHTQLTRHFGFFLVLFTTDVGALKFNDASFPFKLTKNFNKQVPKRASILGSLKQCVIVYLLSLLNGVECMLFRQTTIEKKKRIIFRLFTRCLWTCHVYFLSAI